MSKDYKVPNDDFYYEYDPQELDVPPSLIKAKKESKSDSGERAKFNYFKQKTGIEFDDDEKIKIPFKYRAKEYWHPEGEDWKTSAFLAPYRIVSKLIPFGHERNDERVNRKFNKDWKDVDQHTGSHIYNGKTVDIKSELDSYNKQFEPKKWGDKNFIEKAVSVGKGVSNAVAIVKPAAQVVNAAFEVAEAFTDKSKKETLKPFTYGFLEGKKVSAVELKDARNNVEIQKRNYDSAVGTIFEEKRKKRLDAAKNDYERAKGNYISGALNKAANVIDKIDAATYGGSFVGGGGGSSRNYWSKRFPYFYKSRKKHNIIKYKVGKSKHKKFHSKKYYRKFWSRYPRKWSKSYKYY